MKALLRMGLVVTSYTIIVVGYWALGHRAAVLGTPLTATAADREIPMAPTMVVPYLFYFPFLLWVFLRLALADCFWRHVGPMLTLVGLSMGIFLVCPTRITRIPCGEASWSEQLLAAVQSIDTPGNSLPRLHASLTVFTCLLAARHGFLSRVQATAVGICVVASTVLIKQHLLVDAGAGVLLGLLVWSGGEALTACSKQEEPCLRENVA